MPDGAVKTPEELLSALPSVTTFKTLDKDEQTKLIKGILRDLVVNRDYCPKVLTFAFDVEPLTVERWLDGKGMRAETFSKLVEAYKAILAGKSLRPIKASDTGFVTWRYQIEHEQTQARRIWYIASSSLVPVDSLAFKESIKNLFSAERQQETRRDPPVKIYIYPPKSEAAKSLADWEVSLNEINEHEKELRGSIIGIADDSLPWFLPEVRALVLEKTTEKGEIYVVGYIRVRLDADHQKKLLTALDPHERSPDTPWLNVDPSTAERWYRDCKKKYSALVDTACRAQETPFKVHYIKPENLE